MSLKIGLDAPLLQVALDQTDLDEALKVAKDAVSGGADWVEAGTVLIKSVGISAVKRAKKESPDRIIVAEMKPMDTGRLELELAFGAGADMAIITGLAPISTIEECIQAAQSFNKKVIVDASGMEQLLGKRRGQAVLGHIRQKYPNYLAKLPKKSRVVSSLEVKREGVKAIRRLRKLFPGKSIVADLKAISKVDKELELAYEAGADVACVVAVAGLNEIRKAVKVAKQRHRQVMVDLIGMRHHFDEAYILKMSKKIAETGVDYICYHIPIDDQVRGKKVPPESVKRMVSSLNIPVATAGGINMHSAANIAKAGAEIIIVGGAITKANNPREATRQIKKAITSSHPIFQIALDVPDLDEALKVAKKTAPYVDWFEVGSILATNAGIKAVEKLRELYPDKVIVEDLKVVDFGAQEVELTAKAGSNIIGLWGAAPNSTILGAIKRAKELGLKVMVDLGQSEPLEKVRVRAKELEAMGVDYVVYLIPKDEQALGKRISPPTVLALSKSLEIPLAVAGGLDAQSGPKAIKAGAKILIAGEAIYKARDPGKAAKDIREAIDRIGTIHLPTRLSASEVIKETLDILVRHIRMVANSLDERKTEQFLKVLTSAHRVIIAGVGRSRIVGRFAKNWLNKLGMDVRVIEMGDEDVPPDFSTKLGDILIPISASGKTSSIVDYSATLRMKGKGIVMLVPITARPHGPAWDRKDLTMTVPGRTKEDWIKEKRERIGQRVPLGTLSEFATLAFLLAATQAVLEGKLEVARVNKVMLEIAEELEKAIPHIYTQKNTLEEVVDAILDTKWKASRVVLDGFGRVERINCIFAARLIQVYGLNPMMLRGDINAKIRNLDTVIISSLSGEIAQTFKTVTHCIEEKGLTPIYFTGLEDSPAGQLIRKGRIVDKGQVIVEGKVLGVFIPGTVGRRGRIVSFSERQFVETKKKITPLDNTAEVVLLAIFEGIFACIMNRLGLKERNLEHAELE